MTKNDNQIIYSSDLIVRNSSELATLCVFYDKTLLPYTTHKSSRLFAGRDVIYLHLGMKSKEYVEDVNRWTRKHRVLFQEGVLERVPPPNKDIVHPGSLLDIEPSEKLALFTKVPFKLHAETYDYINKAKKTEIFVKQDLALHLLRTDLKFPQVFISNEKRPPRELMVALEAKAVFSYLIPALGKLTSEQILEVRHKVKDTREGFSMHLQKLSKGLEEKIKGEEASSDIEAWAKSLIETELIPDYREFRRQLAAEKSGFWNKVLDASAKIFEIDAAPWTPKFYGQLLKALGLTALTFSSERKEGLTNKSQAFQFMSLVEDAES